MDSVLAETMRSGRRFHVSTTPPPENKKKILRHSVELMVYTIRPKKKNPLFPVTWVQKTRQGGDKFIFIFYFILTWKNCIVRYITNILI